MMLHFSTHDTYMYAIYAGYFKHITDKMIGSKKSGKAPNKQVQ